MDTQPSVVSCLRADTPRRCRRGSSSGLGIFSRTCELIAAVISREDNQVSKTFCEISQHKAGQSVNGPLVPEAYMALPQLETFVQGAAKPPNLLSWFSPILAPTKFGKVCAPELTVVVSKLTLQTRPCEDYGRILLCYSCLSNCPRSSDTTVVPRFPCRLTTAKGTSHIVLALC